MTDTPDQPGNTLPPGDSAVEIAARSGFGPLSQLAVNAWHGDSRPCVSCGQLVRRTATSCGACGENLSEEMIQRMRAHAGPWYVLEHVRPFPGVTCERLLRQIRRGVLTRHTIVQGPTTDHQWRYAGDTPGLCKYLGLCWKCQSSVTPDQINCPACAARLGDLSDLPAPAPAPPDNTLAIPESPELKRLAELARSAKRPDTFGDDTSRVGSVRVSWIIAALLILVTTILFAVVKMRDAANQAPPPSSVSADPPGRTRTLVPATAIRPSSPVASDPLVGRPYPPPPRNPTLRSVHPPINPSQLIVQILSHTPPR